MSKRVKTNSPEQAQHIINALDHDDLRGRIEQLERRQADAERRLLELSDFIRRHFGIMVGGEA